MSGAEFCLILMLCLHHKWTWDACCTFAQCPCSAFPHEQSSFSPPFCISMYAISISVMIEIKKKHTHKRTKTKQQKPLIFPPPGGGGRSEACTPAFSFGCLSNKLCLLYTWGLFLSLWHVKQRDLSLVITCLDLDIDLSIPYSFSEL